jgi:multimeric flavodoxin WrbA
MNEGGSAMTKVVAINGSPRKNWNTAELLRHALLGAESRGAGTKIFHLYDLNYKGCVSCFACKTKENYLSGRCAQKDGLTPVLDEIMESDAVIMGSPIYLADVTGAMRSLWERLLFMNLAYDMENRSVSKRCLSCGVIYTMNVQEEIMEMLGYHDLFKDHANLFKNLLKGRVEYLAVTDTYQFDDYGRYHAPMFDPEHKAEVKKNQFPNDCERAFEMGSRLADN